LLIFQRGLQKFVKHDITKHINVSSIEKLLNGFCIFHCSESEEENFSNTSFKDFYKIEVSFSANPATLFGLVNRKFNTIKLRPEFTSQPATTEVQVLGKQTFTSTQIKSKLIWMLKQSGFFTGKTMQKSKKSAHFLFFCSQNDSFLGRKVEVSKPAIHTMKSGLPFEVASFLVFLSKPHPEDRLLDPMCGAGTILLARAREPFMSITGFDIDEQIIKTAKENLKDIRDKKIKYADSRFLDEIPDESFNKIIVNPPWDKNIIEGVDILYEQILHNYQRVIQKNGVLVFLTSKPDAFMKAIETSEFTITKMHNIFIKGIKATAFICNKIPH
jgi:tRNA G10  N-methylase Trm11